MNDAKHLIMWNDSGREPQCLSNPAFPDGIDIDIIPGHEPACKIDLPYPAKRCGSYLISCRVCGVTVGCTTAGRPDDPRSIRMPCNLVGSA